MVLSRAIQRCLQQQGRRQFATGVLSMRDKMKDVSVDKETGVVTHNHVLAKDGSSKRTFESMESY